MSAAAFFAEHAGYSYDPASETPEQGRERCARDLAEAEDWGKRSGLTFEWVDDWETGDHTAAFPDAYDEQPDTCESCLAWDESGRVVAGLGCIDDATDEYRRVVEAELAAEVLAEMRSHMLPITLLAIG